MAFAIFLPLLGFVVLLVLAIAWIVLVLLWVTTGMQTRRPLLYILAFTVGLIGTLFLLAAFKVSIFTVSRVLGAG